jgi:hypothetical protein
MDPALVTDPRILAVLDELRRREPIFHRPELGTTRADFEPMTDPGFWEIGASGRRYDREEVLAELERRYAGGPPADDAWEVRDEHCIELAPDVFLFTYTLAQRERVTRRATIWRRSNAGWKIVYHQGTMVADAGSK